jgi:hypothetical protein
VEPLRLPIAVHQLVFVDLSGLRIENRNLLPPRMEITPCNLHRRLLLILELAVLYPLASRSSLKPSSLSHPFCMRNGVTADRSWTQPAAEYLEVYEQVVTSRNQVCLDWG